MSDDIAVITFPERSTTYEAFSKISADSDRLGLVSAALIEVDEHGRFTIPEGEDNRFGFGVGTGSLIGVLVGALGGPIGMLLGLGVGALAGAAVDADRAESDELAVTAFVGKLAPGTNGILAQTSEPGSTAPLDAVVAEQGGTIVRRPLNEVLAELEAGQIAEEEAAKAARETLRKQKRQERRDAREHRIKVLREKFSRA